VMGQGRQKPVLVVGAGIGGLTAALALARRGVPVEVYEQRAGRTLDAPSVEQAVRSMTESVLRNPDALLLFSQLKEKGDYTTSHAVDSAVYMTAFGRFLQLPPEDISLLGYLGLLQDVGKTRLPTELLNKRNRLSEAEFAQAKQHVQYSVEILSETPGLPPGLPELALLHHERQDGSGYPKGLKGRDIGLLGSIAGIIDTFDALTARRPYAEPVPPSAALSMLYKWRGSFFDPVLIEHGLQRVLKRFAVTAESGVVDDCGGNAGVAPGTSSLVPGWTMSGFGPSRFALMISSAGTP